MLQPAWQPTPFTHLGFQVIVTNLKVSWLIKPTRNLFTDNLFIEWWWNTNIQDFKARNVTTIKCCMDSIIWTWIAKEVFSRTCKTVHIVTASLWFLYGYVDLYFSENISINNIKAWTIFPVFSGQRETATWQRKNKDSKPFLQGIITYVIMTRDGIALPKRII